MSKTRLFALLMAVLPHGAAAQQAQPAPQPPAPPPMVQAQGPVLFGRQDFEMEWKAQPGGQVISARYLAARGLMRMEVLNGSGIAVVRDIRSGEAFALVKQGQGGAFSFRLPALARFQGEAGDGKVEKVGPEECMAVRAGPVTLCLSPDGIPLKLTFPDGALEATRLMRQPQHPALFELPKGVEAKPLPTGASPPLLPF